MTVDASIDVHHTEIKAEVHNHDWFWNYKIGGVNFFFDTEGEILDFRSAIYDAYTAYKSKSEIALK